MIDELTYDAKRRKLAGMLFEKQRRMALASFYFFSKYVLGFREMEPDPHYRVCRWLERNWRRDFLLLLPRGTFKSSLVSVGLPLWLLLRYRDMRFLLGSAEHDNSKNWVSLIRTHLEKNHVFRSHFGHWDENDGNTWSTVSLAIGGRTRLVAEDSITAASMKITKVSQHYDVAICDDFMNEKTSKSKELIDQADAYIQGLHPILDPQPWGTRGPIWTVGTRWHFDDLYGRMLARNAKAEKAGQPALYAVHNAACAEKVTWDDKRGKFEFIGKLFFPTRFPASYLDELQRTMTKYLFSCQYCNNPMVEGSEVFRLQDFGFWDGQTSAVLRGQRFTVRPNRVNFATMDPTVGEHSRSDNAYILVASVDQDGNIFLESGLHGQWDIPSQIEKMIQVHQGYHPARFGVEMVGFQRAIMLGYNAIMRERNIFYPIMPLRTDNTISKEMRIRSAEPFVRAGRVFFRVEPGTDLTLAPEILYHQIVAGLDQLAYELTKFPFAGSDDGADAFSYLFQIVFPAGVLPPPPPGPNTFAARRAERKRQQQLHEGLLAVRPQ